MDDLDGMKEGVGLEWSFACVGFVKLGQVFGFSRMVLDGHWLLRKFLWFQHVSMCQALLGQNCDGQKRGIFPKWDKSILFDFES